jgi:hypothetical protein
MKSTVLVLDPASSYNLVSVADVLLELQITDPTDDDVALIENHIAGVSAAIAKYCDRVFPSEKVEETLWEPRGTFGGLRQGYPWIAGPYVYPYTFNFTQTNSIRLKRYPVTSIDSVYIDDVALTSDSNDLSLRTDADNGVLYHLIDGYPSVWSFGKAIVATYTGGYETIPADLQRVALRWTEMAWFASGQDVTLKSEQVYGIASVTYGASTGSTGSGSSGTDIPDEFKLLLEPYIRDTGSFA